METAPSIPSNVAETGLEKEMSCLTVQDPSATTDPSHDVPPHLSHDPQTNLKRTDPFQFGSRLLSEEDNVFEFNAWDHVETDDAYKEYSELQFAKQRESPVSDFDKSTYRVSLLFPGSQPTPRILMISKSMHSSSEVY